MVMGVAVEEDDPRRTSQCKGPGVEHSCWLARSIQGKNGGCIGVRQILGVIVMSFQPRD